MKRTAMNESIELDYKIIFNHIQLIKFYPK